MPFLRYWKEVENNVANGSVLLQSAGEKSMSVVVNLPPSMMTTVMITIMTRRRGGLRRASITGGIRMLVRMIGGSVTATETGTVSGRRRGHIGVLIGMIRMRRGWRARRDMTGPGSIGTIGRIGIRRCLFLDDDDDRNGL